jgi:hypothetical protein
VTISEHLRDVLRDWRESQQDFPINRIENANWPIPFFGNPAKAVVTTIGVNPASGEFEFSRGWVGVKKVPDWKCRLRDYFNIDVPPHTWFTPWRPGLKILGTSYEEGTAAHFDVSYRTTTAMLTNTATDRTEFGRMVERDVAWLFRLLPICEKLRMLLVFGPILRPDGSIGNLTQFLKQHAPNHGFTVSEHRDLQHTETGKVFFIHETDTRGEASVTSRVVKNVTVHREELRRRLETENNSTPK